MMVEASDELTRQMMEGDPSCELKIGDKIKKSSGECDDITTIGTKGRITGSIKYDGIDCYLVLFSGRELHTFITGKKLEKDDTEL